MMKRFYHRIVDEHIHQKNHMLFLVGPRSIGKTTVSLHARALSHHVHYLSWDNKDDQHLLLDGGKKLAKHCDLDRYHKDPTVVVLDEISKFKHWKTMLKTFFDTYRERTKIIVTGNARLDLHDASRDKLHGHYHLFHLHPLSTAELIDFDLKKTIINPPKKINHQKFVHLLKHGGFPEPFLRNCPRYSSKWQSLRYHQLLRQDIKHHTKIHEIGQVQTYAHLLEQQAAGHLLNYSHVAERINASVETVHRWTDTLSSLYYCFALRPWSKHLSRTLTKEPKIYLWDWSVVHNRTARLENFVASHLLKAVHHWNEHRLGHFDLYYIRDWEKREVDFLVTRNNVPWFLVDVPPLGTKALSYDLEYYQDHTKAQHAFQIDFDLPFETKDCFQLHKPSIVPALTFLSQLV